MLIKQGCICTSVVLALGEGYQQVVGGGATRLVTYPQGHGTLTGLASTSHTLVGQGYPGSLAARAMPYPQPQVQMPSGPRKYLVYVQMRKFLVNEIQVGLNMAVEDYKSSD